MQNHSHLSFYEATSHLNWDVLSVRCVLDVAPWDGLSEVHISEERLHRAAGDSADQRHPPAMVAAVLAAVGPGPVECGARSVGFRQHPRGRLWHQPQHPPGHLWWRWVTCHSTIISVTAISGSLEQWNTILEPWNKMSNCPYYRDALMFCFLQRVPLTKRVGASIPMLSVRPASAETRRSTCIGPTRTKTGRTISWRPENSLFSLDTSYSSRLEHKMFEIRGGAKRAEAPNVHCTHHHWIFIRIKIISIRTADVLYIQPFIKSYSS